MKNLAATNHISSGKIYMVELTDGKIDSYRVIAETPTHFIFSYTSNESVEVFEKAKSEVIGIYEVKEWIDSQEEN